MFFGKQKFDLKQLKLNKFIFGVKQLKINKFTFDVEQLKMNRFIKSISDLTNSTSNATLEVPSLRPWVSATYSSLINGIIKITLNFILNWQNQKPHRKDLVLNKKSWNQVFLFELRKISRNRKSILTARFQCL